MARFRPEPPREVSPSEPAASNESNSATPTTPRARLPPTATHGDNRAPPQNDRIKPDFRSSWRSAASAIQSCWLLGSRWLPSSAAIANAWIWKKFCVSALALPDAFSHNPRPHGSSCRSLCGLDMHCRASRGARRADGEANSGHRPIRDPPAPLLAAPAEAATPNSRAPPQGDRPRRRELHWYLARSQAATHGFWGGQRFAASPFVRAAARSSPPTPAAFVQARPAQSPPKRMAPGIRHTHSGV
mmetsp:Transcript_70137/g.203380  ORF Transcript_70137/g.203380 Transcript_70137/m.203380 type:complete len:244 (+) Transcript_70137:533-1264(+)